MKVIETHERIKFNAFADGVGMDLPETDRVQFNVFRFRQAPEMVEAKRNNQREDLDTPIWKLTTREVLGSLIPGVQEAISLYMEELREHSRSLGAPPPDIISIQEAALITGLRKASLYSKVSRLEAPVISRGRPLRFSRTQLLEWMALGKPRVAEMEAMKRRGKL